MSWYIFLTQWKNMNITKIIVSALLLASVCVANFVPNSFANTPLNIHQKIERALDNLEAKLWNKSSKIHSLYQKLIPTITKLQTQNKYKKHRENLELIKWSIQKRLEKQAGQRAENRAKAWLTANNGKYENLEALKAWIVQKYWAKSTEVQKALQMIESGNIQYTYKKGVAETPSNTDSSSNSSWWNWTDKYWNSTNVEEIRESENNAYWWDIKWRVNRMKSKWVTKERMFEFYWKKWIGQNMLDDMSYYWDTWKTR